MNDEPVLTARQASAKWWNELKAQYPYHFTFLEDDGWSGTGVNNDLIASDNKITEMVEWCKANAGVQGETWRLSGSTMGGDICFNFADAEIAMRFKLTFVGVRG